MVSGDTHTNLIFDAVVPFECKLKNSEVAEMIKSSISNTLGNNYFAVITLDKG